MFFILFFCQTQPQFPIKFYIFKRTILQLNLGFSHLITLSYLIFEIANLYARRFSSIK
jgi:hypothetical protein